MMIRAFDDTQQQKNERLVLFSGALTISSGVNRFSVPKHVNADLKPGLKVVVLLSGRLRIRISGQAEQELSGPAVLMIRNFGSGRARNQVFAPDIPVRYALAHLDETIAGDRLAGAIDRAAKEKGEAEAQRDVLLLSCPAGRALQSLASQILSCPIPGAERELYLGGKALQMTALAVADCLASRQTKPVLKVSSRDVEKIYQARDILIASMREPPRLSTLAQHVGLNSQKLNRGFRHIFGATVYGFLQDYRLEEAYRLLSTSEMSVSEVAYHVGYGPAHFATAFRERFGMPPSQLR